MLPRLRWASSLSGLLVLTASGCQAPVGTPGLPSGTDRFAALLRPSTAGEARVIISAPGLPDAALRSLATRHHLALVAKVAPIGVATFALRGATTRDLAALDQEPGIRYVERDVAGAVDASARGDASSVPSYRDQWDMQRMRVAEAWQLRNGSNQAVVGIVDTGVDLGHSELQPKIVAGTNLTTPGAAPQDDLGHGTAVAGIVGAIANNGHGLVGVAPNCRLMPIKVNEPGTGQVRASSAAAGLVWAADHGANVINMSVGFEDGEAGLTADTLKTLNQAVSYALSKGVLVVCAAGNTNGQPTKTYPAVWSGSPGFEGLIAVGASDRNDQRASYSNTGPWLSVVAPADDIPALAIGGYGRFGGTSAAAPHVSGLAALLITPSRPPSVKNLRNWMMGTARDLGAKGFDPEFGSGCVDAVGAIQASAR